MSRSQIYVDGQWITPISDLKINAINPSDESLLTQVALCNGDDVDNAVAAAANRFADHSAISKSDRMEMLKGIRHHYSSRIDEMAEAISREMGAPVDFARNAQAAIGEAHIAEAVKVLSEFEFIQDGEGYLLQYEPIGVVGMITPWNWPMNQIMCKLAPALAAGCTVVLKPSELAPLSAFLLAEIMDESGVPPGVFNLVTGDGATTGAALAAHERVDMISITGSTRAGISVAKAAADSVKRVAQELGGKSAYVLLEDADIASSVVACVRACFLNSGQSCNAPTRLLVPRRMEQEAIAAAVGAAEGIKVDLPSRHGRHIGPLVSEGQFNRVQDLIRAGMAEGAKLIVGGPGKPAGFDQGFYARPTIFAGVDNAMRIAQEEIFGPVLCIIPYDDEKNALDIANDSRYGLTGFVQSRDPARARAFAMGLRTGSVLINNARPNVSAPFGGYKLSGNGREWGEFGFREFLEIKSILG